MDFNTGGSGAGGASPRGSGAVGSSGGVTEFTLSDPVGSFIATVRSIVLTPVQFFRGIRTSGDFVGPMVFALICSVVAGVLGAVVSFLSNLIFGNGAGAAVGGFFSTLFLTPIFTLIGLFIGAGIYHLLVMLLVRPNAGFEGSFRVVAYSSVVQLVSWVPIIGGILALYIIVLDILGMREVHGTTTGRAAAVILIPVAILFVIVLALAALLGFALFLGTR